MSSTKAVAMLIEGATLDVPGDPTSYGVQEALMENPETPKDPETREEWQDAVDQAHFFSLLHSARLHGLVSGGPEVKVGKCEEILRRGAGMGFLPRPDAVERCIAMGLHGSAAKRDPA